MIFYKFKDKEHSADMIPFDGSAPYIHWSDPFSTGLIRYFTIYAYSDKPSLNVKIPENDIFSIFSAQQLNEIVSEDTQDVSNITWQVLNGNRLFEFDTTGVNGLHAITFLCQSDVEGEYIEDITIDEEEIRIGAQFWEQNEPLEINLQNMGAEIPSIIQKAIYSNDIFEDHPDWILLNRKFKELLINYMEVLGNKGSMKSLQNALSWFEYGDLVELREVWKYETLAGTKYAERPVQQWLTSEMDSWLFNSQKSTYISLSHPKKTNLKNTDNNLSYDSTTYDKDSLDNKVTSGLTCVWSEDEMRLKMYLLGAFYEQYFMPIHLNLLRSSIEDVDNGMIFKYAYGFSEAIANEDFQGFDQPAITISGLVPEVLETESDNPKIVTKLNLVSDKLIITDNIGFTKIPTYAKGIMVPLNIKFDFGDDKIVLAEIRTNNSGQYINDRVVVDKKSQLSLDIQFPFPGDYEVLLQFVANNSENSEKPIERGKVYTSILQVHVKDNIKLYVNTDQPGEPGAAANLYLPNLTIPVPISALNEFKETSAETIFYNEPHKIYSKPKKKARSKKQNIKYPRGLFKGELEYNWGPHISKKLKFRGSNNSLKLQRKK